MNSSYSTWNDGYLQFLLNKLFFVIKVGLVSRTISFSRSVTLAAVADVVQYTAARAQFLYLNSFVTEQISGTNFQLERSIIVIKVDS